MHRDRAPRQRRPRQKVGGGRGVAFDQGGAGGCVGLTTRNAQVFQSVKLLHDAPKPRHQLDSHVDVGRGDEVVHDDDVGGGRGGGGGGGREGGGHEEGGQVLGGDLAREVDL